MFLLATIICLVTAQKYVNA